MSSDVEPLTDLAAKVTAAHVPFELVEKKCSRVPEPVLLKLITWSFPRSEADIRRYSAVDAKASHLSKDKPSELRSGEEGGSNTEDLWPNPISDSYFCARPGLEPKSAFKEGELLVNRRAVLQSIQIGEWFFR